MMMVAMVSMMMIIILPPSTKEVYPYMLFDLDICVYAMYIFNVVSSQNTVFPRVIRIYMNS